MFAGHCYTEEASYISYPISISDTFNTISKQNFPGPFAINLEPFSFEIGSMKAPNLQVNIQQALPQRALCPSFVSFFSPCLLLSTVREKSHDDVYKSLKQEERRKNTRVRADNVGTHKISIWVRKWGFLMMNLRNCKNLYLNHLQ